MYYMSINKNFVHQVGDQPRLYYDARSTNHQELHSLFYLETALHVSGGTVTATCRYSGR